ncbi:MAG TPA: TRAP transporter substrate-binding protein [Rhodocyclaceae bacterium]|jgi:TRAP-type mannitol/chloroaromatic compound transport system substrate-binding protein|nr:TRAP transporter substrate-binding protein [Rhodocyclaceae bacterium]
MSRRRFVQQAVTALAGSSVLAACGKPVKADVAAVKSAELPVIKWRLASSYPKSLDTIFGAAKIVAERVALATDGRFQIEVFAGGELMPGNQVMDAVQKGTVPIGHTTSYYYVGKDPAFAFDTAMPFGMNSRQHAAWMWHGGGMQLVRDLLGEYNIHPIPCGNTGAQMGGWYRKEINSLADLKGLKLRIGGLAGQVMQRLGVLPQQIPGNDLYPALEKGAIDAAEWVGPYDDEKFGFQKIAKYYYTPAWWEGGAQLSMFINQDEWKKLPPSYQAILEDACAYAHTNMQAAYDAKNLAALKRLIGSGVELRFFPKEMMEAAQHEAFALYAELAAKNPRFARIYVPWRKFRDEQMLWFGVAERPYDNFVGATASALAK